MIHKQERQNESADRTENRQSSRQGNEAKLISLPHLVDLEKIGVDGLLDDFEQKIKRQCWRSAERKVGENIASQSEFLTYSSRIRIDASSTDELRELQQAVEIDESTIRDLQSEAELQRLHPSRREEFIKEVLKDRIDSRVEKQINQDQVRTQAEENISQLFNKNGSEFTFTWRQKDSGSFSRHTSDSDEPDLIATVSDATKDFSETPLRKIRADFVVLREDASLTVESPFGTQQLVLDRGAYKIRSRSIRALAEEAGLIDVEKRRVKCESSDRKVLNIEVSDTDDKAKVLELNSGSGGYSRRYTEAWTEYRDFDPEREMVLITVGQTSFYRRSLRGKQERTWLVGRDEGQTWTHQVYNSHSTIDEALEFVKPAEVQRLEDDGREVIRQGDVFFVEMVRKSNFEALEETRHDITRTEDNEIVVSHPEHDDIELTGNWKALLNNDGSQS